MMSPMQRHSPPRAPMRKASVHGLALFGLWTASCYPLGYNNTQEYDTVLTWRSPATDFSAPRTYALANTVADLCAGDEGELPSFGFAGATAQESERPRNCIEADHRYDETILAAVRENMNLRGFEEVPFEDGEEPDVVILPGIVSSRIWFVYQTYPWWYYGYDWGWGGFGPGWGVGYRGVAAVAYPTGTIVLDMLSLSEVDEAKKEIPSAWVATIRGIIAPATPPSEMRERIAANIDQAFLQSPYLERGEE